MGTTGPTRRSSKGNWTPEEDEILCRAVHQFQGKSWKRIAEFFPDRTTVQCLHRWQKVLNPELVKGPWSKEEDEIIVQMVQKHGPKKWSTIAQALPGRIGKQCRERWLNQLNPEIKKEAWSKEEEIILIDAHSSLGNKWAALSKYLPGRTENSIKNWWNCSLKKRINTYEQVPRDAESTGKKQSQVISFSHSQGRMVNDGNSLEMEIDTSLEVYAVDNPDKENIPPEPGSGSKTTPIKEGATEQSLAASGGVSDSNMISCTEMGFSMSPVASYNALAQEVGNKKSAAKRDLARDENSRPNKQPRMTGSRVLDFTNFSSPVRLVEQRRIWSAGPSLNPISRAILFSPSPGKKQSQGMQFSPLTATPSTGKNESRVILFSPSQGKMHDVNNLELEIDTSLEDKENYYPCPGSGSGGTVSSAIKELQMFAAALLAEDKDALKEESLLLENFQNPMFSPKLLKKC